MYGSPIPGCSPTIPIRRKPLSSKIPFAADPFVADPFAADPSPLMSLRNTAVMAHRTPAGDRSSGKAFSSADCAKSWKTPNRYALDRPITGYVPSGMIILSTWLA